MVRVLITGGSSGIGLALAKAYAQDGAQSGAHVYISGQSAERLDAAKQELEVLGATVEAKLIDVRDENAMAMWLAEAFASGPLDLVVANAGVAGKTPQATSSYKQQLDRVMSVNVQGVFNTVLPAIDLMETAGGGQIAIVSSLAGFRGLPTTAAYSASKAAVKSWGEALRPQLAKSNIRLSVICPGFVRSRITDENKFPMPFFMEADKAANLIKRKLARNVGRIAFPFPMYMGTWFLSVVPDWLGNLMTSAGAKRVNK
ncbi:MAG: SDR family NAD(P)-dependent oxidoreductase [Alphaproteobacteria bacterium]